MFDIEEISDVFYDMLDQLGGTHLSADAEEQCYEQIEDEGRKRSACEGVGLEDMTHFSIEVGGVKLEDVEPWFESHPEPPESFKFHYVREGYSDGTVLVGIQLRRDAVPLSHIKPGQQFTWALDYDAPKWMKCKDVAEDVFRSTHPQTMIVRLQDGAVGLYPVGEMTEATKVYPA